jgi:hypothetical protein
MYSTRRLAVLLIWPNSANRPSDNNKWCFIRHRSNSTHAQTACSIGSANVVVWAYLCHTPPRLACISDVPLLWVNIWLPDTCPGCSILSLKGSRVILDELILQYVTRSTRVMHDCWAHAIVQSGRNFPLIDAWTDIFSRGFQKESIRRIVLLYNIISLNTL